MPSIAYTNIHSLLDLAVRYPNFPRTSQSVNCTSTCQEYSYIPRFLTKIITKSIVVNYSHSTFSLSPYLFTYTNHIILFPFFPLYIHGYTISRIIRVLKSTSCINNCMPVISPIPSGISRSHHYRQNYESQFRYLPRILLFAYSKCISHNG